MSISQKKHFRRTLGLMNFLGLETQNNIYAEESSANLHIGLKELIKSQSQLAKSTQKRLKEILAIEHQKLSLLNDVNQINSILNFELACFKYKETVLSRPLTESFSLKFRLSPCVTTYESDWNWFIMQDSVPNERMNTILLQPEKDYYFALQQTGTYDLPTSSNVLELELTVFEFFILSLFEKPSTISAVIQAFEEEFECKTMEEQKQLRVNAEALIRILIFQMFIVAHKQTAPSSKVIQ